VPKEYIEAHKEEIEAKGKKKDPDYNVRQSKIAIGSGEITGKGL
jgi:rod shape determining protein RodA